MSITTTQYYGGAISLPFVSAHPSSQASPPSPSFHPIERVHVDIQNLAQASQTTAQTFFDRLKDQPVMSYIGALYPIAMAISYTVEFVKDFIRFIKACFLGLGRDIGEYVQNIVKDLLKLISSLLAPMKFFMDIFAFGSPVLNLVATLVSGVFSVICFIWQIVGDGINLHHTNKALEKIDDIMEKDLPASEKTSQILAYFNEIREERRRENKRVLENVPDFRRDDAVIFLEEHTILQMEKMFGKEAYYSINQGLEALEIAEGQPEEMLKAIESVRCIKDTLKEREFSNWLDIAACICALAATVLSFACPPAVAGLLVVSLVIYGLWTIAALGWVFNGVQSYIDYRAFQHKQEVDKASDLRIARTVTINEEVFPIHPEAPEQPSLARFEEIMGQLNSMNLDEEPEVRREAIEEILLSSKKFEEYHELLLSQLEERIIEPYQQLMDLAKVGNADDSEIPLLLQETLDNEGYSWKEIIENYKHLKEMTKYSTSFALRDAWVSTFSNPEDIPLRS
jgi:hypothetical protein